MKMMKQILSLLLVLSLAFGMAFTAQATESTEEDPEEAFKKQLKAVYNMEVQSNKLTDWPKGPGTYGEAAIIMEAGTGAILYAKNIDDRHYPASITKVLTALIALENSEMDDPVKMTEDSVAFLQPGDSSIGLKKGNKITIEQCLYATLLASANEAAYALGENVGLNAGHDYDWFIEQMNTRMKELGGQNSHFTNTNGLHDKEHYTSARDMALVGKEIFKHPEFFEIVQTPQYVIKKSKTVQKHVFQQKHKMLLPAYDAYYEDAIGGKTGYTSDALSTLITMADNGKMQLICVVLRTHGKNIYPDTTKLFEYAFKNFKKVYVEDFEKSEDVGSVLTDQGGGYVMLPKGVSTDALEMELVPDNANNGEATLNYTYEGNPVGSARIKLSQSYVKAHALQIEDADVSSSEDSADDMAKADMPLKKKLILAAAVVVLVLLAGAYIRILQKRKKRRRRRRRRK